MIVSRRPEGLVIVRQVDHQSQCLLMAEAWGNDDFARPDPYAPLAEAAACHDEGWREWEDAPQVDATGAPIDFPDLDRARHTDLYRVSIAAAVGRGPRTGLLVSMHGQGLYERRLGLDGPPPPAAGRRPEVTRFLGEQRELQARLRRQIGEGPGLHAWAWDAYRLLQAWDTLSLYLLWRALPAGREGTLVRVPRHAGDPGVDLRLTPDGPDACVCDPYPFAEPEVALPVAARTVADRPYRDDEDLRAALAAATATSVDCRVRASSGRPRT